MPNRRWTSWAVILGFALGGFFDGILLHQILQWHHLLSLVDGLGDLRVQVLWDGYFHALMYIVAAIGWLGLWRARAQVHQQRGRCVAGALMMGFGLWHIVDGILSHWLLGIHRIKLDSPDPLVWDLIWFALFGLVPLIAGWLLLRRRAIPPTVRDGPAMTVAAAGLLTGGLAVWSLQPPLDQPFTTVVFAPSVTPAQVMNALTLTRARLVWSDPRMGVVVVALPDASGMRFYSHGALLVSGSGLPGGCFNWSRA